MLDKQTEMLAHHERKMGNKAVPIFQKAVLADPELHVQVQVQGTAAVYTIVQFLTRPGDIMNISSSQCKMKAETQGARRKWVRKE